MAKIQTVGTIKEFMTGEWKQPKFESGTNKYGRLVYAFNAGIMLADPAIQAMAATDDTFNNLFHSIMNAFDCGVVLVIVFAGACWALGHRTKAIEILIGVCAGYLLARHAIDIRDWLKKI